MKKYLAVVMISVLPILANAEDEPNINQSNANIEQVTPQKCNCPMMQEHHMHMQEKMDSKMMEQMHDNCCCNTHEHQDMSMPAHANEQATPPKCNCPMMQEHHMHMQEKMDSKMMEQMHDNCCCNTHEHKDMLMPNSTEQPATAPESTPLK